jgi:hypothetical protein
VVVGQETLTLEDYFECRLFYLTVGVFYMDEILFELIEFLKTHGIKASAFIRHVHTAGRGHFSKRLADLYDSFAAATRTELWDSREALVEFMQAADRTEEDIRAGRMGGYNVIYWHRAQMFTGLVEDVVEAAFGCARDVLPAAALEENAEYLAELQRYMLLRKRNIFDFRAVYRDRFTFDFVELDRGAFRTPPRRLDRKMEIEFFHTGEQAALFGNFNGGVAGAARTMAKLCMPRMYRTMKSEAEVLSRAAG